MLPPRIDSVILHVELYDTTCSAVHRQCTSVQVLIVVVNFLVIESLGSLQEFEVVRGLLDFLHELFFVEVVVRA